MNDEDMKLLRDYVSVNKTEYYQFIRRVGLWTSFLRKNLSLMKREFYMLMKKAKSEKKYDHAEV